jgi:hypothetical protein
MPARTQRNPTALTVTFHRDGESPTTLLARDGDEAWGHALRLIGRQHFLLAGDTLCVRRADDDDLVVEILRTPDGDSP